MIMFIHSIGRALLPAYILLPQSERRNHGPVHTTLPIPFRRRKLIIQLGNAPRFLASLSAYFPPLLLMVLLIEALPRGRKEHVQEVLSQCSIVFWKHR